MIEDLLRLLTSRRSRAGFTYLFLGRHPCHHWKHLHPNSADRILTEAFSRASTHSFRRTALTSDEQRRDWAADYSRNQRSQQPRTIAALFRREAGSSQRSDREFFHAFLQGKYSFFPALPFSHKSD